MQFIILVIALVVGLFITASLRPGFTGFRLSDITWRESLPYYGAMVAGMSAREIYNALVHGRRFNWVGFAIAAVVSPLVFRSMLGDLVVKSNGVSLSVLLLAFQNGFFWNSIFEGIQPSTTSQVPGTPTPVPTP